MWFYILMPLSSSSSELMQITVLNSFQGREFSFLLRSDFYMPWGTLLLNIFIHKCIYKMFYLHHPHLYSDLPTLLLCKDWKILILKIEKWGARLSEDRRENQKTTGNERKVKEENTQSPVNFVMAVFVTESSSLSASTVSHLAVLRFWLVFSS